MPPHLQLRRISNPSQLSLGRYPTTRGSGRMSPRERNKFLFAGFGRISVTRILSLQSKTEKKAGIFCTKQPLCAVFYGGFLLFEAVRPRNLAAGTEKSEPRKRNSRPRKKIPSPEFFPPAPFFFRRRPRSPFSRYLELFHRQIPDVNMSAQAPPGLRAPAIPARKQLYRQQKESLALYLPTFGFPHTSRDCVFCARHRPLPRTSESQGPSNDKVSNPRKIAKCQIRCGVSAGKHETVPRYISTVPINCKNV